jgi:hypothetical protein
METQIFTNTENTIYFPLQQLPLKYRSEKLILELFAHEIFDKHCNYLESPEKVYDILMDPEPSSGFRGSFSFYPVGIKYLATSNTKVYFQLTDEDHNFCISGPDFNNNFSKYTTIGDHHLFKFENIYLLWIAFVLLFCVFLGVFLYKRKKSSSDLFKTLKVGTFTKEQAAAVSILPPLIVVVQPNVATSKEKAIKKKASYYLDDRSNLDLLPRFSFDSSFYSDGEIRYTMDTTFNAILTVRKSEDTFRSLVRSKNIRSDEVHGRASIDTRLSTDDFRPRASMDTRYQETRIDDLIPRASMDTRYQETRVDDLIPRASMDTRYQETRIDDLIPRASIDTRYQETRVDDLIPRASMDTRYNEIIPRKSIDIREIFGRTSMEQTRSNETKIDDLLPRASCDSRYIHPMMLPRASTDSKHNRIHEFFPRAEITIEKRLSADSELVLIESLAINDLSSNFSGEDSPPRKSMCVDHRLPFDVDPPRHSFCGRKAEINDNQSLQRSLTDIKTNRYSRFINDTDREYSSIVRTNSDSTNSIGAPKGPLKANINPLKFLFRNQK